MANIKGGRAARKRDRQNAKARKRNATCKAKLHDAHKKLFKAADADQKEDAAKKLKEFVSVFLNILYLGGIITYIVVRFPLFQLQQLVLNPVLFSKRLVGVLGKGKLTLLRFNGIVESVVVVLCRLFEQCQIIGLNLIETLLLLCLRFDRTHKSDDRHGYSGDGHKYSRERIGKESLAE